MRQLVALVIVILSIGSVPSIAQQKLDFSGTWQIVPGSSQANGVGGLGREFTAVQDDKTLTITTMQPVVGKMTLVYRLDGKPSTNTFTMGPVSADRVSTVAWEGHTLVINSTVTMRGMLAKTTQVLWLENGELVTEQTSEQGASKEVTRAKYRKK